MTKHIALSQRKSSKPKSLPSQQIAELIIEAAINQKALDVKGLDVTKITDVADSFVIASGTSQRHVKGIADKISEKLKSVGEPVFAVSGYESGDWVLLDFGNVVVHVFYEPVRQYYDLDSLWQEATQIELPDKLKAEAKFLRTGVYR